MCSLIFVIWHVRVELYDSSFQLVNLKMSKRKLLLNYDPPTLLLGVSFIMCVHIFLFPFELSNYVTSFAVGSIVVSFKYIANKTSIILFGYAILIFFILSFLTYAKYLRLKNLLFCDDIETIPFNQCKSISFYHWNLNGLLARNCEKFHLVEAFVVSNNVDIFCISETFLDLSVDNIYDGLNINDYNTVRIDHSSNTNHGGAAIYYEDHLPVIRRNISSLNESIVLEMCLAKNVSLPVDADHLVKARVNLMNFV